MGHLTATPNDALQHPLNSAKVWVKRMVMLLDFGKLAEMRRAREQAMMPAVTKTSFDSWNVRLRRTPTLGPRSGVFKSSGLSSWHFLRTSCTDSLTKWKGCPATSECTWSRSGVYNPG